MGDLARPVDAQVALPLPAGGHALLTLRGDPAHVEVVVRGAGPRPDPDPGETLVTVLPDGRRAELVGVAACVIDPDGSTAAVSPALAELAATPARILARDGITAVVDESDHGRVLAVARRVADDAVGVRIQPGDGGPTRWVDIHGVDLQPATASIADPAPTDHGRLLLITELHARAGDLARAAHRASAAFHQAPSGRARLARDGVIAAANPALARFFEADPDHLIGHRLIDLIDHGDRAALRALLDAVLRGDLGSVEHEVRLAARVAPPDENALPRPDEPPAVWVRLQVESVTTAASIEADVELHDITSRRRAENDHRDTVDALRSAFIHAPTPMALVELDGTIREANSELRALLDLGLVDSQPLRLADLAPEADRHLIDGALAETTLGRRGRVECRLRRHDGSEGVVELAVSAVTTPDHLSPFAIAQVNDITARRDTEEKLLHQTLHDPLTGLGNRLLLRDRLERATANRGQVPFALMFIDLDHFKWVNDTHGHEIGDALLVEVARRLRDSIRTDDTVARLGGDEFVVLATGVKDAEQAGLLASKVRAAIAEPVHLEDHVLNVTASVGVVLSGSEHTNADALLRDADLSMYQAKSTGRNRHQVTVGSEAAAARPPVAEALRLALDTDSLRLHHQPVIDLRTGRAVGTEALLRIADPVTGTRPPGRLLEGVQDAELLVAAGGLGARQRPGADAGLGRRRHRPAVDVAQPQRRRAGHRLAARAGQQLAHPHRGRRQPHQHRDPRAHAPAGRQPVARPPPHAGRPRRPARHRRLRHRHRLARPPALAPDALPQDRPVDRPPAPRARRARRRRGRRGRRPRPRPRRHRRGHRGPGPAGGAGPAGLHPRPGQPVRRSCPRRVADSGRRAPGTWLSRASPNMSHPDTHRASPVPSRVRETRAEPHRRRGPTMGSSDGNAVPPLGDDVVIDLRDGVTEHLLQQHQQEPTADDAIAVGTDLAHAEEVIDLRDARPPSGRPLELQPGHRMVTDHRWRPVDAGRGLRLRHLSPGPLLRRVAPPPRSRSWPAGSRTRGSTP